ncbi:SMP-30/gluconolactonase/LRE family protein [Rhizobiales bacterium RZME27]|uniref:SMP-30/gluconolactonase/LRE family protein n=1 Tax=Endobacterium cereale TaxID=2663029 RepID=A0A6A8ACQ4_9HYPH|nr:SMP-30/gluconolactonase/LRE family protein [Endobacterium cereale]MEB2846894.1 SMP-30/gluconolactonase/LRE family protein [Endobacterium cereale]MQY47687.1 SMP-30/gluconolactonase/LRE family protein [Endobacterium cereale]
MTAQNIPFKGTVLSSATSELGEGPTFDPHAAKAWWFNIVGQELHELDTVSGETRVHPLPFMGSVLARIDAGRQLIASDKGLFIRDTVSGEFAHYVDLEADKPGNRSNDGRVHQSGALWIGTMGRKAEDGAGAIYHVAKGQVTKLFDNISITNAICFSPDGTIGYFVDTKVNQLMQVALDAATGLPTGQPSVLIDNKGEPGGMDGAVCDAEGKIWNARWGAGLLDCYAPDGTLLGRYEVPVKQPSCPAFFGENADRLLTTSAWQGMDENARKTDAKAGNLVDLGISVRGRFEPDYLL